MTTDPKGQSSFSDYLGRSLSLFAENYLPLINLSFLAAAPMVLRSILDTADETGVSLLGLLISPLAFCMNTFFLMTLVYTVASLAKGEVLTLRDAMAHAWGRFFRGLGGYLILTVLVFAGLFLFILPGVYCITAFNFFVFAILLEDEGLISSFKRSAALVHPSFWRVLGANALLLLLAALVLIPITQGMTMMGVDPMVITVVVGVAGALLMPVFVGFYYFLFDELRTKHDGVINIAVKS